ncbi:unnamed protein product [Meganyctiphanes norvegica]|uniref:Uncharacterized protein n=1 Tax=Meganyctiphanes norvegica TaxID=48144 RepID=A0AAV2QA94_MEGNR
MPTSTISSYPSNLIPVDDVIVANESYSLDEARIDAKLELLQELEFLSSKTSLGVHPEEMHLNDKNCMEQFYKELHYDSVMKNYTVALPWKPNKWSLATNENLALKRMQQLQRKFMQNPKFGNAYASKIQELLTLNFIEEVTPDIELGDLPHYLAHSGVLKDNNNTTNLRIVMDGSCKANASSLSLNDCLYTGPNLIGDLLGCLLGFRCDRFALTADIEKAFLHLQLRIQDRDSMRFFFPTNIFDPTSHLKVFRYKVVVFGASCSHSYWRQS